MKANQKFLNNDDEAVSPVIAVILMVAITVVLAATVYVWVSGFGQSGSQAKNLSVTEASCTSGVDGASASSVVFTIVSISPNFLRANIKMTDSTTGFAGVYGTAATANSALTITGGSSTLGAGDALTLATSAAAGGANDLACAGDTINLIDTASNTVIATVTIHA